MIRILLAFTAALQAAGTEAPPFGYVGAAAIKSMPPTEARFEAGPADRPAAPLPVGTVFRLKQPLVMLAGRPQVLRKDAVECTLMKVRDDQDVSLQALRLSSSASVGFSIASDGEYDTLRYDATGDRSFAEADGVYLEPQAERAWQRYRFAMAMSAYGGGRIAREIARAVRGMRTASYRFERVGDSVAVRMECIKRLPSVSAGDTDMPQFGVPQVSDLAEWFAVETPAPL